MTFYVCVCAIIFSLLLDWSVFDSFFFCFVTLTTIGFLGAPQQKVSKEEIGVTFVLVCTVYLLTGLTLIATWVRLWYLSHSRFHEESSSVVTQGFEDPEDPS